MTAEKWTKPSQHEGSDLEIRAMANDVQNRKRLSTTTTGRDKLRDQENALELLEVAVCCVDPVSDGQEISVRTSCRCVVLEYRNGLPRDWTQRSDARNSGSVYVGDG